MCVFNKKKITILKKGVDAGKNLFFQPKIHIQEVIEQKRSYNKCNDKINVVYTMH